MSLSPLPPSSTRFFQSTLSPPLYKRIHLHKSHNQPTNEINSNFAIQIQKIMGNITSCIGAQSNAAKFIHLNRKTLRLLDLPATAADLMLEHPGSVISPVNYLRRDRRFSAMKADDFLAGGGVYVLIPVSRVNGKVSESEMANIESLCGERRPKRRSSKVLPVEAEVSGDGVENPVKLLGEESDTGRLNYRLKQWKPALEPIYEGN